MNKLPKIPYDIYLYKILPYLSDSDDLNLLKSVNKFLNKNINTHHKLYCYNCESEINDKNCVKCDIANCMASDPHIKVIFYTINDYPLCSMSCAIAICDGLIY